MKNHHKQDKQQSLKESQDELKNYLAELKLQLDSIENNLQNLS